MFFDDEVEFENNPDALNQRLYDDLYHYLADNDTSLEDSDAMLWIEADQKDDEMLNEILEVTPSHARFDYECRFNSDGTFDITLFRDQQRLDVNYDSPNAFDEQFGYLFTTLQAAQQIEPEMSYRWWVGIESSGELEDGVRPLVVLTWQQWQMLEQTFGAERIQAEFQPIV